MNLATKRLKLFVVGVSLLLVSTAVVSVSAAQSAEIISVETQESQATSVLGSTVIPAKEVMLSAQIPGRVLSIDGDVGKGFNAGAVVVDIDSSVLQAKRNAVYAQMATAQAALRNAQAQYQRELISPRSEDIGMMPGFGMPAMMDLMVTRPFADMAGMGYNSDIARYSDLVNSSTGLSQAQASLRQAGAQLQEIETKIRDARSIVPFPSMMLEKHVEVGDTVQPGQPLVRLGDVKRLRLKADVPSGLVSALRPNMKVKAKIDGINLVETTVSQIYPIADPQRHTVIVKFDLPEGTLAAPGMYAEVMLPLNTVNSQKVNIIPKTALLRGRSLPSVLVVKGDTSELRLVRLGSMQGSGKIEVVSGLSEGDRVINNPKAGATSGWMPNTSDKDTADK